MRIDDLLSAENIRRMARMQAVGDVWPYSGGTELEIESHIKVVVAALKRVRGLIWEADFSHYGSGYASYVDAFAYRRDGHGVREASPAGSTRCLTRPGMTSSAKFVASSSTMATNS